MAKVVWTAEAEQWLRRIHDCIAADKPAAAFGVVESLYGRAEILAKFPDIGHTHTSASGRQVRILLGVTTDVPPEPRGSRSADLGQASHAK